jgi:DnaJ-class molecular chaperone
MAGDKDYYKVLGVDRKASDKDIKMAFRKLARQYHPDVNKGDRTAEARFKEINEAYGVLSDKDKRARYDQFGAGFEHAGRGQGNPFAGRAPGGRGARPGAGMGDMGNVFGGSPQFSDLFNDLFARAGGQFGGGPEPPRDVESPLELTLEEVARGAQQVFKLNREDVCPTCQGSGRAGRTPCSACHGRGQVTNQRSLTVEIPKGVREGARIRIRGEGGTLPGGRSRDLYLVVRYLPHRTFEVKGEDVYCEVPLSVTDAVLGATVSVPTLRGKATMQISQGTSSNRVFRMGGLGLPAYDNKPAGDLYVRVRIVVPAGLSAQELELYQRLAALRPGPPSESGA